MQMTPKYTRYILFGEERWIKAPWAQAHKTTAVRRDNTGRYEGKAIFSLNTIYTMPVCIPMMRE